MNNRFPFFHSMLRRFGLVSHYSYNLSVYHKLSKNKKELRQRKIQSESA